jgi:small multidrug resistance family-3 protein
LARRAESAVSPVQAGLPTDLKALSLKTILLFVVTAIAEIVGCYLPYLWLTKGATAWLLLPAAVSLGLFAWLLTLHPAAAGRVYAAYGGVYIAVALAWLWGVDGVRPSAWDVAGVVVSLSGMALIAFQPRTA